MTPKQIIKKERDELAARIVTMKQRHEEAAAQESDRRAVFQQAKSDLQSLDEWLLNN